MADNQSKSNFIYYKIFLNFYLIIISISLNHLSKLLSLRKECTLGETPNALASLPLCQVVRGMPSGGLRVFYGSHPNLIDIKIA